MITKIITTYSFSKLKNKLNSLIENTLKSSGDTYKGSMKKILNDGRRLEALTQIRLDNRKAGVGWMGKSVPPTSDKRPLIQTGTLRDSMRSAKEGVYMEHYGIEHYSGKFMGSTIGQIPERPFIRMSVRETKVNKVVSQYYKNLKMAFKK